MKLLNFKNHQFLRVNGREFDCHAAYAPDFRGFAFFILQGPAPLAKEDLPTKSWQLVKQKGTERSHLYIIYNEVYFQYAKRDAELMFVAPTLHGAQYLALKHIAQVKQLEPSHTELTRLSQRDSLPGITSLNNDGNMKKNAAVYLRTIHPELLDLLQ